MEPIRVPLTDDEAAALATEMTNCRDASVATHWRLGRSRLDGTTLVMHRKWAGIPVAGYLIYFHNESLASVRRKILGTWK
jgi:hypothetical protein